MKFAQGIFAFGFWIVLALGFFMLWTMKARKTVLQKFAENDLLKEIANTTNLGRRKIKLVILLIAIIFSILALMRPQWGFQWQEIKRRGLDIFIAIDTSKSMLATDVKPNRLERSKLVVKDLIKKLNGDRVGLIAFSGTAFVQCPLTIDYDGFLLALDDLNTETISRGGTSIACAIEEALKVYKNAPAKFKILVIITDGENLEGDTSRVAEQAKKEGLKVFCVGIGTTEGDLIQITDQEGNKNFLKDREGNVVKSRLNERELQNIALATGGSYVRSSGAEFGLDLIYEDKLSKMEKKDIKAQMNKLYHERFQIPLAVALVLLIIELLISDKKRI